MARTFTITQEGESREFTVATGVGPSGVDGVDAEVTLAAVRAAVPNMVEVAAPAENDFIQRGPSGWLTKTIEQVKTALGLGTAAYTASTDYAFALGADDNYVTDAEKTNIGNLGTAAYTASTAYASALGADDNYVTDAQKAALHAAATVTGNGIAITGQAVSLSIGTGSTQVAAGNHSHALLDSATDAATAGTLVKRGSVGQVSFAGDATATALSAANSGIGKGAEISSAGGHGAGISSGSGTGAIISTSTGQFGADIYNYGSGTGAYIGSYSGTGAEISSGSGTYHATFGLSGNARAFVARLLGAFGWWRGAYTLMVSAVDTLTANRVQRFPDKDGTVALTSDITGTNSGTNTGDQTTIAGITGTVAQFNAALTDGDFATLAGTEALTNKTLTNPAINNYVEGVVAIGTVVSTNTLALTNGTRQRVRLTASTACAFAMPTATDGKSFVLEVEQAATTGNGTATFGASGPPVDWGSAGAPTITVTAGKMDIITFMANGTKWFGAYNQGYTY